MKKIRENLRPLFKYLKPYKKAVWAAYFFVAIESVVQISSPVIFGKVVDLIMNQKILSNTVYFLLAGWVILNLIQGWSSRMKWRRIVRISYQASTDLIAKSLNHIMRLPLGFHKEKRMGEIIQRVSRADGYMYRIIEGGLFYLLPNIVTAFLAFSIIAWIQWKLALMYVIFVSLFIFMTIRKVEPIIRFSKKINKVFENIYGNIYDRATNIVNIKSNSTEDFENERNIREFDRGYIFNNNATELWLRLNVWENLIFTSSFVLLFFLGIRFVSTATITIGQFVMLLSYINLATAAISNLANQYKDIREGLATINRSEKVFQEEMENYNDPESSSSKNIRGGVEFQNVKFAYQKEDILKNISFKVSPGQMIAIVGKSGEGKTTLLNLLSRYMIPRKGRILIDGINIQQMRLEDLRRNIAIVPQEIHLFNDSIKNNIGYSNLSAKEEEIIQAAKLANCHEFIEKFPKKYQQMVGERGVKLSTGQKQRVAIARAILRDPKILILDEATSALDSESERLVQSALEEVMKNRTTFVIAHRLSTIRKADLILVIENGEIVESGDHQELIQKGGVYQKLSELQNISV